MTCDRCGRTEYPDYDPSKGPPPECASMELKMMSPVATEDASRPLMAPKVFKFEVLCTRCDTTVNNYIDQIMRTGAKEEEGAVAPPPQSPPKQQPSPSSGSSRTSTSSDSSRSRGG